MERCAAVLYTVYGWLSLCSDYILPIMWVMVSHKRALFMYKRCRQPSTSPPPPFLLAKWVQRRQNEMVDQLSSVLIRGSRLQTGTPTFKELTSSMVHIHMVDLLVATYDWLALPPYLFMVLLIPILPSAPCQPLLIRKPGIWKLQAYDGLFAAGSLSSNVFIQGASHLT